MPTSIGREEVLRLAASGAPVVDVLPPNEHEEQRIAGSVGIWLRRLDAESVRDFSSTDPIVVYCHDDL